MILWLVHISPGVIYIDNFWMYCLCGHRLMQLLFTFSIMNASSCAFKMCNVSKLWNQQFMVKNQGYSSSIYLYMCVYLCVHTLVYISWYCIFCLALVTFENFLCCWLWIAYMWQEYRSRRSDTKTTTFWDSYFSCSILQEILPTRFCLGHMVWV